MILAIDGNSSQPLNYSHIDNNPLRGVNYYCLKQVDVDAKHEYSIVRSVTFGKVNRTYIYPNPTKDNVQIIGLNGNESISLYDITGRKLNSVKANATTIMLSLDKSF